MIGGLLVEGLVSLVEDGYHGCRWNVEIRAQQILIHPHLGGRDVTICPLDTTFDAVTDGADNELSVDDGLFHILMAVYEADRVQHPRKGFNSLRRLLLDLGVVIVLSLEAGSIQLHVLSGITCQGFVARRELVPAHVLPA